jgi:peptidase E
LSKQIVALGGGGCLEEPDNPLLDEFILQCTGKEMPAVCFIGAASGDLPVHLVHFYQRFGGKRSAARHLPLFERVDEDLRRVILSQDVVYVGGGSTLNLLAIWRTQGLDEILAEAYAAGVVMAGVSAGMNCWFEESITDSYSIHRLGVLSDGLGLLPGGACPHYDGDEKRRPALHEALLAGEIGPTYAADNGAALHFVEGELSAVVSSRLSAHGYRVDLHDGEVRENLLSTDFLGKGGSPSFEKVPPDAP